MISLDLYIHDSIVVVFLKNFIGTALKMLCYSHALHSMGGGVDNGLCGVGDY